MPAHLSNAQSNNIKTVVVVGGGLVGSSWASLFLARGLDVIVVDPRQEALSELRKFIEQAWPNLRALELTTSDSIRDAEFTTDISDLRNIDFVQECAPDRIEVKLDLVAQLEQVISSEVVIASSTSSLMASDIQRQAQHPERILVGHPMNPPHLVPLVELIRGKKTAEKCMRVAEKFYNDLQRVTIRAKKEVVGHVANRLTSALYREAVNMVAEGISSVEDIDKAITYGPGMRWALLGPHLTYHLGGGVGGYEHYLSHLGPTQEARWKKLGAPKLSEELKTALVAGVEKELQHQDVDTLVRRRDNALVELFDLKKKYNF